MRLKDKVPNKVHQAQELVVLKRKAKKRAQLVISREFAFNRSDVAEAQGIETVCRISAFLSHHPEDYVQIEFESLLDGFSELAHLLKIHLDGEVDALHAELYVGKSEAQSQDTEGDQKAGK